MLLARLPAAQRRCRQQRLAVSYDAATLQGVDARGQNMPIRHLSTYRRQFACCHR